MSTSQPTPIWIDCDTGHDDAVALLLTACNPACRLLGASTVHGNGRVQDTVVNTKAVLQAIGRPDVPVYMGSQAPWKLPACFAPDIHGETGLDGVTLLPKVQVEASAGHASDAISAMADAIMAEPPQTVWLLATGPLTNVAYAFKARPELASHIKGLSIMGGAVGDNYTDAPLGTVEGEGPRFGNTTPFAEFNIYADPHAAQSVFQNPALSGKTALVTLDLSHNTRATLEVRERLFQSHDASRSKVRRLFEEITVFFAATYEKLFGISDGPPLHDPLTVIAAVYPDLLDDRSGERWNVSVVLGDERWDKATNPLDRVGQTVLTPATPGKGVRVPRAVDLARFWDLIDECLAVAEQSQPESR